MWPFAAASQCCRGDADAQATVTHLYSPFAPAFDFNLRALARPAPTRDAEGLVRSVHCQVETKCNTDCGNALNVPLDESRRVAQRNALRNSGQHWPRDTIRTHIDCHYRRQVHLGGGKAWPDLCDADVHRWAEMRATPQKPEDAYSSGWSTPSGSPVNNQDKSPAPPPTASPTRRFFPPPRRVVSSGAGLRAQHRSLQPTPMMQMDVGDRIDPNLIVFGEVIGEGSFGAVYRGLMTGQDVAIKRMKLSVSLTPEEYDRAIRNFENEVSILKTLRHPNIVTYLGLVPFPEDDNTFVDEEDEDDDSAETEEEEDETQLLSYCIVTEYCPNGTLMDLLSNSQNLSWARYLQIAKDIVSGLHFLHFKRIIHRDLKPGNVLMTASGKAKLADFGLSHVKESREMASRPYGVCGTKCFVAPEVLRNERYGFAADIFSLGVILCQMVSGAYPFDNSSASRNGKERSDELSYEARILAGERPKIPSQTLPDLKSLIESCWRDDPARRPPVSHVMKWLDSISRSLNISLHTTSNNLLNDVPIRSRKFFEDLHARITQANTQLQQLKSTNAQLELQLQNSEELRKVQVTSVKLKYEHMLLEKENEVERMRRDIGRLTVALHHCRSRSS